MMEGESLVTTKLGVIGLYRAIKKSFSQPNENKNQYVNLTINNMYDHALVDIGATHNFVTKVTTKRQQLKLTLTNSSVKTMNVKPHNAHGVASAISVKLGNEKGTTRFTIRMMDIFHIVLGKALFIHFHTLINPYIHCIQVME